MPNIAACCSCQVQLHHSLKKEEDLQNMPEVNRANSSYIMLNYRNIVHISFIQSLGKKDDRTKIMCKSWWKSLISGQLTLG